MAIDYVAILFRLRGTQVKLGWPLSHLHLVLARTVQIIMVVITVLAKITGSLICSIQFFFNVSFWGTHDAERLKETSDFLTKTSNNINYYVRHSFLLVKRLSRSSLLFYIRDPSFQLVIDGYFFLIKRL